MGLRFRKSIKLGKGVKLNLGKKGVGLSFGTKGARVSLNSSGRKTATFGIPGTGLSYSTSLGSKKKTKSKAQSRKITIKCPNCGSTNCSSRTGTYEKTKKHSWLLDLLLIFFTAGLWIFVMIFRRKKPEIVENRIYTCKGCGYSWNIG